MRRVFLCVCVCVCGGGGGGWFTLHINVGKYLLRGCLFYIGTIYESYRILQCFNPSWGFTKIPKIYIIRLSKLFTNWTFSCSSQCWRESPNISSPVMNLTVILEPRYTNSIISSVLKISNHLFVSVHVYIVYKIELYHILSVKK